MILFYKNKSFGEGKELELLFVFDIDPDYFQICKLYGFIKYQFLRQLG